MKDMRGRSEEFFEEDEEKILFTDAHIAVIACLFSFFWNRDSRCRIICTHKKQEDARMAISRKRVRQV